MKKTPAKGTSTPQHIEEAYKSHELELSAMWSGPLPPPQILEEFNQVVPNGAERIITAWEKETEHRRSMERRELGFVALEAILGKIFAFLFVLAALSVCAYAAAAGAEWLATILGTGVIGSVVWAFVKVNRPRNGG